MTCLDTFSVEREKFATFVVNLVSRDTATFYRGKKAFPIDQECVRLISLYSYVFFDASHGIKPTIQELGLFLEKGDDIASLYQDACYWYQRWNKSEESIRCYSFCEELNSLVQKKAREVCSSSWLLLPDFRGRREEIRRNAAFIEGENIGEKEIYFSPAMA